MNWQELANMINARNDYQLLQIGWLDGMEKHAAYMHYERSLIQRVVFHENLFSVYLAWEAYLDPFLNLWFFHNPPKDNGESVQIIDANVTNIQPLMLEMLYGKTIFRVRYRNHSGMLRTVEIDPSSIDLDLNPTGIPKITLQEDPSMIFFETGSWIIPHGWGPAIEPIGPNETWKQKFIK